MRRNLLAAVTLALLLPLAGCDSSTGAEGPRTLSILLTDDPGQFEEAWVTIDSVKLVGEGVDAAVLMDEPVTTDLITWHNDVMTLVDEVAVPEGSYSQLRLIISGACIVVGEGRMAYASGGYAEAGIADECLNPDGGLQLPSYAQTGLKINLPGGTLAPGGQAILLDFVVPESFGHEAGKSGKWVMHPVIKAENVSFTGTVEVTLALADGVSLEGLGPVPENETERRDATLEDFEAWMQGDAEGVAFDGDGKATFYFVHPDGDGYDVWVELAVGDLVFEYGCDPDPVPVGSGEMVYVTCTITSAALPAAP